MTLKDQYIEMRERMQEQSELQQTIRAFYGKVNHQKMVNILPISQDIKPIKPDEPSWVNNLDNDEIIGRISALYMVKPEILLFKQSSLYHQRRRIAYLSLQKCTFSQERIAQMFLRKEFNVQREIIKAEHELTTNIISTQIINRITKIIIS